MKTHTTREVEDDINHVEWVPAEVAQGLYDALSEMAYECDLNDLGMRMQSYDQAMDALAAADGEDV